MVRVPIYLQIAVGFVGNLLKAYRSGYRKPGSIDLEVLCDGASTLKNVGRPSILASRIFWLKDFWLMSFRVPCGESASASGFTRRYGGCAHRGGSLDESHALKVTVLTLFMLLERVMRRVIRVMAAQVMRVSECWMSRA